VIDVHAHLVPAVDDGPNDAGEAVALARQAAEQGIAEVVATPHVRLRSFEENWAFFEERYDEMRRALDASGVALATRLAAELYYEPGVERLVGEPRLSLDGAGRAYLIEVSMGGEPEGAAASFAAFAEEGWTPVLAHPERVITFLEEPERLDEYLGGGALLQVNGQSLLGNHRPGARELAEFLVRTGRAHVVASDAHDTRQRPFVLAAARARVAAIAGEEVARALVDENPRRLLAGEPIRVAHRPAAPDAWPRRGRSRPWLSGMRRRILGERP
jgi:protein-tyrosine phosphatase